MKKSDLIKSLERKFGLNHKDAKRFVDAFFEELLNLLVESGRVELRGLGVFKLRRLGGRFIKNPKTGVEVYVDERYTVSFKPSKALKR